MDFVCLDIVCVMERVGGTVLHFFQNALTLARNHSTTILDNDQLDTPVHRTATY